MANISNKVNVHDGAAVGNWISQIHAGNATYDIATHHKITFKDGSTDTKGVTWNGLTDLEVIIPSITDIVQSPIVFAGTVDADGIHGNASHKDVETEPKEGYLVFVTADCTFDGKVCEAGDMAIYDGKEWKVITGENQVSIVGNNGEATTTVAVGSAKNVLTVEGKTLALVLDYAELDKHVNTIGGNKVDVVFGGADAKDPAVKSEYIKLAYTSASDREIATQVSFENATKLADGKVTFTNDTFVTGVSFGDFNAGSFPTYKSNGSIDLAVAGGSLSATTGEDFVTSVSLPAVSVAKANDGDTNVITAVTGISNITGTQSFLTDIHLTDAEKGESANLTIGGYLAPNAGDKAAFVTGLADNKTTVITDIVAGKFSIVGSGAGLGDFVTGLDTAATEVVTAVSVSANNDTDVINETFVSDNVLYFGTTKVTSGVTATPTTAKFTKAGVSYTETTFTSTSLLSDGFSMTSDVKYTFGSAKETICGNPDTYSWKVVTPELAIQKGKYTIADGGKVTIAENTFLTGVDNAGTLPSLTNTSFSTGKVVGSVATALTTETKTINALAADVTSIAMPGTYSLTTVNAAEEGTVTVGKAGALDNMAATVDLTNYLTDVTIVTDVPKAE
jgi:hypothetical protein